MINAVPSTPYFALATQIYNSAPYMLDLELGAHRRRPGGDPQGLGRAVA
jgi:hypothetical protein